MKNKQIESANKIDKEIELRYNMREKFPQYSKEWVILTQQIYLFQKMKKNA